jgi:glutathione S-transferase
MLDARVVIGRPRGSSSGGITMVHTFPYCAAVTAFALVVYWFVTFAVGKARATHNVPAPAMDGPPEFQRAYRVQANMVEQMVFFLPSLWLFANAWGDILAAVIGVFWPIGRILYARGYYIAADKRGPGFLISMLASIILLIGGIVGIVWRLVAA